MNFTALRGMRDILPSEVAGWRGVESAARGVFELFGYSEIRTPILEMTELFKRGVGEGTDIVNKEMYSLKDQGGRDISLRPEGTAPIVRAYLENKLGGESGLAKLYYIGPMFRSERPQKGRNRQFHQIGVEAIGSSSPYVDAEAIVMMGLFFEKIGLSGCTMVMSSLGCAKDKKNFSDRLARFLAPQRNRLCDDCKVRLEKNVLRTMDCKSESCRALLAEAPSPLDGLCDPCRVHYDKVKGAVRGSGMDFRENPRLVRGLDYYTNTVFEVIHSGLGAQDAICAGGRYDNLVRQFGGPDTAAFGFALGVERTLLALGAAGNGQGGCGKVDIYVAAVGDAAFEEAFRRAHGLRKEGVAVEMDLDVRSLKAQMRQADKKGVRHVAIFGDDEMAKGEVLIRSMDTREQKSVKWEDIAGFIKK